MKVYSYTNENSSMQFAVFRAFANIVMNITYKKSNGAILLY